jgi:hypothetical protein
LPARHCELNGPNRVRLSPLSVAALTVKWLSARTRCSAWLLPACPGSWPNPILTRLPSRAAVSSNKFFDVARVGPRARRIQQPISTNVITAELDANRPIRVVELGLFGRGEIPIADDLEICGSLLGNGAPFALEIEPGGRPDLPIAAEQPLTLEQR